MSTDFATGGARTEHLFSKLIAGGLSAGVVLLWWPHLFPHDTAGGWVARGIAWTLLAEILVVAVSPLEHALRARAAALGPVGRVRSFFSRWTRLRAHFALGLATLAVSLALTLIATGHPAAAEKPAPRVTKVTRVVKVVKQVKVKRIVVRETVPAPGYPRTVARPAVAGTPQRPAATERTATPRPQPEQTTAKDETAAPTPTPAPTSVPDSPTPAPGA